MIRFTGMLAALLAVVSLGQAQQKKRVAVLDFDYATVQSGVAAMFGSNQDVGKGIADLLVDKLVQDGRYSVIERKALDKVLAEQNFSNSNRADSSTAAKIGKVLGVEVIIIGSITQFGRDDKSTDIGGGALGGIRGRFGIGGVKRSKSQAVVGITARMINTDTAEILASVTGKGESTRSGTGLLGEGGSYAGMAAGALDMKASNFSETLLGEATHSAVNSVAVQLDSRASSLPTKVVVISGLVADVSPDGTVIINVGSRAGVKVGDRLEVAHKVREVRDPATGKVLRLIENQLGELTITEVEDTSAVGKFNGPKPPSVGDTVKNSHP
jgi:curli biogenesis system outer membrane secretion channel CsgG